MDPFGNSIELKEDIIPPKKTFIGTSKLKWLILVLILGIVAIIVFLIIILLKNDDSPKYEKQKTISEISCFYNIYNCSNEIALLGEDYENIDKSILNIEINGAKIDYTKKYKFSKNGKYQIKFNLNKNINMDNMFKNITDLYKIEMFSNKSTNIISMKSSFENCFSLQIFYIKGFNTKKIKSLINYFIIHKYII